MFSVNIFEIIEKTGVSYGSGRLSKSSRARRRRLNSRTSISVSRLKWSGVATKKWTHWLGHLLVDVLFELHFKFHGADVAHRRVPPFSVVKKPHCIPRWLCGSLLGVHSTVAGPVELDDCCWTAECGGSFCKLPGFDAFACTAAELYFCVRLVDPAPARW